MAWAFCSRAKAAWARARAALELVKRGHQLAADDVVDICRVADDRLIGESPEMVRHFMEIRGIGIIDIRAMYGVGSVIVSKSSTWSSTWRSGDSSKEYDRLGLTEETVTILGVKVPYQTMPVRPGRNLAIIIEWPRATSASSAWATAPRMSWTAASTSSSRRTPQITPDTTGRIHLWSISASTSAAPASRLA